MIWIEKNLNLFDAAEHELIYTNLDAFVASEHVDLSRKNFYNRCCLDIMQFPVFTKHVSNYVFKHCNRAYEMQSMWINKISSNTNKDDHYHRDNSHLTMVLYLNDTFVGGEFEYIEYDTDVHIKQIKPEINLAIFSTRDIVHRVLPVQSGIRYSLVCFFYKLDDIY